MILCAVEGYIKWMCMKEDNPGPKNIKGDNLRQMIICGGWGFTL